MKGFRYRQAYAILEKKIEAGEIPRGTYKFVIGVDRVTPRVRDASLTAAQVRVLDSIITICTYMPVARRAA